MNIVHEKSGNRAATRARLVSVFNQLLLSGRQGRPRVAEVIAGAGVARSTFYDHFDGIEALASESLEQLFYGLSEAILDDTPSDDLAFLLSHIWENRRLGREMLTGEKGERAQVLLARVLESKLEDERNRRLIAILLAGTLMSGVSGWLAGRINATPAQLAATLYSATDAIRNEVTD
ncbi:TetR/AcrR family transcriptional regulator [Altererythrobacter sp.]|uniref:TetR/AcrR family transcriptional regulator n=1 Tax=Altererythrobacter sp. TaxID=1872480 RepID=UPI001B0303C8|nr:TetR/AcrR family transcriptional regulator [Altererythrobacter sp.]MBO6945873.1 TetR/AcrR family transcriptional regulator [Altererythrobacter sp.]